MALFVKQDENRSELQKRLATELQARAKKKAEEADLPDGVDDSRFIQDTKVTTSLLWLWMLVGLMVIGAVVFLIIVSAP